MNSSNFKTIENNKIHIVFIILLLIFAGIRVHYHKYYSDTLGGDEGFYLVLSKDISKDLKIGPPEILLWDREDSEGERTRGFYRKEILDYSATINVDECRFSTNLTNKTWRYTDKHWYYGRPPVIPYLLGISFHLFGVSDIVADNLFLFIGISSIIVIYILSTVLYNPKIGLLTAFFFGLSPIHVLYTTTFIKMLGIPLMTFMTLTMLFIYLAVHRNSISSYMLSGLMLGISFLTKYPGGVLYLVIPSYVLLSKRISNKQKAIAILIIVLSSLIVLTPWFLYNQGIYGNPIGSILSEMEFDKLDRIINDEHLTILPTLRHYREITTLFGPMLVLLAFIGFFVSLHRKSESDLLVLSSIIVLLLMFHIFRLYARYRYMLPVLPFLSISCAVGFNHILNSLKHIRKPVYYRFILIAIVSIMLVVHVIDVIKLTEQIPKARPNIYRYTSLTSNELIPPDAVIASNAYSQTNLYLNRTTTRPYTSEELIRHFNISFFFMTGPSPKHYSILKYLMYNPRFKVIKKIEYMNKVGYIFKVIEINDGVYYDNVNKILTNYTDKQFSVYQIKNNSLNLIYSGFDGAENSVDHIKVPNLIVRVDGVSSSIDVINLKEIACVCDRYGCDKIIWAVKSSTDSLNENKELMSFLKGRERKGDYVFIYGVKDYSKLDIETQIALLNRSSNQLESFGLHPVGFVPYKNKFNKDTLKAVGMLNLKAFSAGNGDYNYPGVNIIPSIVVYPKGDDRYWLRDKVVKIKNDLHPLPTINYSEYQPPFFIEDS